MTQLNNHRITIIFFIFCTAYSIIGVHLYVLQIRQTSFFSSLASQQYHMTIKHTPSRAEIFDRTGKEYLALNKECISAFITPKSLKKPIETMQFLANHFPQAHARFAQYKNKSFMYIKRKLSEEEQNLIKLTQLDDLYLLQESSRYYPVSCAGHIIGFTDIDNSGISGIELAYNSQLAGKQTVYSLEKDARSGNYYFKKETKVQGHEGLPIQLTIDANLQFLVDQELQKWMSKYNAEEGGVIILDPLSGDILVMASRPHFDPNNTQEIDIETIKNRLICNSYELGSVIKVFLAMAALEEKVVSLDELIDCRNTKTTCIDGRKVNTPFAHGIVPFEDVIALSNNIGTALIAKRLDSKLYTHYRRLGFGTKTTIEFPAQAVGFVNPPENWSKQSLISLSYGYEITATLLQLACAFGLIAQDGYPVHPRLILDKKRAISSERLYSRETIEAIRAILLKTVTSGTGKYCSIPEYVVRCKTGTTNLLVDGEYDEHKHAFTCAGIVEKENGTRPYKRVIVTFIKNGKGSNLFASTVAAPLFAQVARTMIIHERAL